MFINKNDCEKLKRWADSARFKWNQDIATVETYLKVRTTTIDIRFSYLDVHVAFDHMWWEDGAVFCVETDIGTKDIDTIINDLNSKFGDRLKAKLDERKKKEQDRLNQIAQRGQQERETYLKLKEKFGE